MIMDVMGMRQVICAACLCRMERNNICTCSFGRCASGAGAENWRVSERSLEFSANKGSSDVFSRRQSLVFMGIDVWSLQSVMHTYMMVRKGTKLCSFVDIVLMHLAPRALHFFRSVSGPVAVCPVCCANICACPHDVPKGLDWRADWLSSSFCVHCGVTVYTDGD